MSKACYPRCYLCISANAEDVPYHYIVIRKGLPPGVACAMVAHAASGSTITGYDQDTHAVILAADREQLDKLSALLRTESDLNDLFVYEVHETDGAYAGEFLALGVDPGPRGMRKPYFEHLSLYRGEQ